MKIYTKGGDQGETGLLGGKRVPKDTLRIEAYGTLDELNSALGLALSHGDLPAVVRTRFQRVQSEIFQLGSELATPAEKKLTTVPVLAGDISRLEHEIDEMESELPALQQFILPGGSSPAAAIHLCRTVCRRAERLTVTLGRNEPLRPEVIQYLNRLSDYFFVSARYVNLKLGVPDLPWAPKKPAS